MSVTGKKPHESSPHMQLTILLSSSLKSMSKATPAVFSGNDSRTMQAFGPFGMSVEYFNWIECIHIALRGSTDQAVIAHEAVLVCTSLSAMVYAYDTYCSKPIGMAF